MRPDAPVWAWGPVGRFVGRHRGVSVRATSAFYLANAVQTPELVLWRRPRSQGWFGCEVETPGRRSGPESSSVVQSILQHVSSLPPFLLA